MLEVAEGSAAEGVVAVGDCVVEVDPSVRDAIRNVADAVDLKRALHTLVVERIAPAPRGEEVADVVLAAVGRRWADGGDDGDDGEEVYGRLRLRCPECDATVTGELGGPQMERLRDAMDAEAAPAAPPSRRQSRRLSASPRPAPAPAPAAAPPPPPPDPAAEERRAAWRRRRPPLRRASTRRTRRTRRARTWRWRARWRPPGWRWRARSTTSTTRWATTATATMMRASRRE